MLILCIQTLTQEPLGRRLLSSRAHRQSLCICQEGFPVLGFLNTSTRFSGHEHSFFWTMEWRSKKRNAPPAPPRRSAHAHRSGKKVCIAFSDDEEDWLVTGGLEPKMHPSAPICAPDRATDVVATAPVAVVNNPAPVAALSFDDFIRKYPPLKIRVVSQDDEGDDWLDEK